MPKRINENTKLVRAVKQVRASASFKESAVATIKFGNLEVLVTEKRLAYRFSTGQATNRVDRYAALLYIGRTGYEAEFTS